MTIPLIILAVLSVTGGFFGVPEALHGTHWLGRFLEPVFAASAAQYAETGLSHETEYLLMGISIAGVLLAIAFAWFRYVKNRTLPAPEDMRTSYWHRLSYHKFYVDEVYDLLFVRLLKALSRFFYTVVDVLGIDGLVNGAGRLIVSASRSIRLVQNGNIGYYVFAMVIGIILIFIFNFIIF
jgi:NADH-quinone oxidoreductase subunit L